MLCFILEPISGLYKNEPGVHTGGLIASTHKATHCSHTRVSTTNRSIHEGNSKFLIRTLTTYRQIDTNGIKKKLTRPKSYFCPYIYYTHTHTLTLTQRSIRITELFSQTLSLDSLRTLYCIQCRSTMLFYFSFWTYEGSFALSFSLVRC